MAMKEKPLTAGKLRNKSLANTLGYGCGLDVEKLDLSNIVK
tara:strand:+ start:47 stop:169 length:123 start_codon:yes stop_codon:yes gene_type:complete